MGFDAKKEALKCPCRECLIKMVCTESCREYKKTIDKFSFLERTSRCVVCEFGKICK